MPGEGNFKDDRHALFTGWLLGRAMRKGLPVEPVVDDNGDYLPKIRLVMNPMPAGLEVYVAIDPPPDDWQPDDDDDLPHGLLGPPSGSSN